MVIMKFLENILQFKSSVVCGPMIDEWNDMPETFPVSSIYKQSFLHPFPLAAIGTAGLILEVSGFYQISTLYHQSHNGLATIILLSLYLLQVSAPFCLLLLLLKSKRRKWTVQNRRIQIFINRYQMNALGQCLSLMDSIIRGKRQTHITDRLVRNLKLMLEDAGNHPPVVLTGLQRSVLCGLVDPDNMAGYGGKLKKSQRQKLVQFGLALSKPAITAMGTIGGQDCITALKNRLNKTESSSMRVLVCDALKRIDPRLEFSYEIPKNKLNARLITRMSLDIGHLPGDSSKVSVKHNPHLYLISISAFTALYSELMYQSSKSHAFGLLFLSSLITYPIYCVVNYFYKVYCARKLLFTYACQDNPVALRYLLTSYFGKIPFAACSSEFLLILNETVQNINSENVPVLNRLQIERYHKLITSASQVPTANLDQENPLPNLDLSSDLVAKLSLLGNERSVEFMETMIKRCPSTAMQWAAKASLPALRTRLAITPQEMLRSSPAPRGELLNPTSDEVDSLLLRSVNPGGDA